MSEKIEQTSLGTGYIQLKLSSWKQYLDYIYEDMLNFESYVWRGQRCDDWKLEPTIDRLAKLANIQPSQRFRFQQNQLEKFKLATRGRRGPNPSQINDENDWWALGQHHGLATPLLDWTTSPFVAAFFAFSEVAEPQTDHRAIFALHQPSIEDWATQKKVAENRARREQRESGKNLGLLNALMNYEVEEEVIFVRPMSDENHRLVNQGGLFTKSRTNKNIEEWLMENHPENDQGMTLIKFLIPNGERDKCLRTLNRMNISPLSLFPDLAGASKYCNLFSEVEHY